MENKNLQIENGNYTRISNELLIEMLRVPFKGSELAVMLYIIRKTYGYNKTQDEISLTQFEKGTHRCRQTVSTALANLQLVEMVRLVKKGNIKGDSNIWAINKYHKTWKLVNMVRLVKRNAKASLTERINLVYTARHTKEITKETKDIATKVAVIPVKEKEPVKKVSPLKDSPLTDFKLMIQFYHEEYKSRFDSKPAIAGKDCKLLKTRLNTYKVEEIKEFIEVYLQSKKCEKLGGDLGKALSTDTINAVLANRNF